MMLKSKQHHILVAQVQDHPGVLNRVASLFRRRMFNIESLTVGHTDQPGTAPGYLDTPDGMDFVPAAPDGQPDYAAVVHP